MKRLILFLAFLALPTLAQAQTQKILTKFVQVTPTVDTSAYASGDTVGSLMTFTNICEPLTKKGQLLGVKVFDKAATAADIDLVLFNSSPSGLGTFTDNAAFDPDDALLLNIAAYVAITTHKSFNDNGISYAADIVRSVKCNSSATLYGYLVARAARTQASVSDLTVQLEVVSD